ncbi:MAG: hypothetical protein J4473_04245 [Candidatus Aenigmarchaeota archaeon]|nr:hypothetical protein [Candidatus Aenigmarchaeota archaeon]
MGNETLGYSTTSWSANDWHHIAGTWSTSGANLYVDGVSQTSVSAISLPNNFTEQAYIGNNAWQHNATNGTIDEVGVWNRTLTSDEIRAHGDASNTWINITNLPAGRAYNYVVAANDTAGNIATASQTVGITEMSICTTIINNVCYVNHTANLTDGYTFNISNLVVQSAGIIQNITGGSFTINATGNVTVNNGGSIGFVSLNQSSVFSPVITIYAVNITNNGTISVNGMGDTDSDADSSNGGNLTVYAATINNTGLITAVGGSIGNGGAHSEPGNGGNVVINATSLYSTGNITADAKDDALYGFPQHSDLYTNYASGRGGIINITAPTLVIQGSVTAKKAIKPEREADGNIYLNYTTITITTATDPAYWIMPSKTCGISDNTDAVLNNIRCELNGSRTYNNLTLVNRSHVFMHNNALNITVISMLNVSSGSIIHNGTGYIRVNATNVSVSGTERNVLRDVTITSFGNIDVIGNVHSNIYEFYETNEPVLVMNATDNITFYSGSLMQGGNSTCETCGVKTGNLSMYANTVFVQGNLSLDGINSNGQNVSGTLGGVISAYATTINITGILDSTSGISFDSNPNGRAGSLIVLNATNLSIAGIISVNGGMTDSESVNSDGNGGTLQINSTFLSITGSVFARCGDDCTSAVNGTIAINSFGTSETCTATFTPTMDTANTTITGIVNSTVNVSSGSTNCYEELTVQSSGILQNTVGGSFTINATGNVTVMNGGTVQSTGASCSSGTCQIGGNITLIAMNLINITGRTDSTGGTPTSTGSTGGNGGIVNISAQTILITNNVTATGGQPPTTQSDATKANGGAGGTIILNATTVNITGVVSANGGGSFTGNADYTRGSGGTVNITGSIIDITGVINASRGSYGGDNNGYLGNIYLNYENESNVLISKANFSHGQWIPNSFNCNRNSQCPAGGSCIINNTWCKITNQYNFTSLTLISDARILLSSSSLYLNVTGMLNISNGSIQNIAGFLNITSANLTIERDLSLGIVQFMSRFAILNVTYLNITDTLNTSANISTEKSQSLSLNTVSLNSLVLGSKELNLVINADNITVTSSVSTQGLSCTSGTKCGKGGNITFIAANLINITGTIETIGALPGNTDYYLYSGDGGIINFTAPTILVSGNVKSTGQAGTGSVKWSGGDGNRIVFNASTINITGSLLSNGGQGPSYIYGDGGYQGKGGIINLTASVIDIRGVVNTIGRLLARNNSIGGNITINSTSSLSISGNITSFGSNPSSIPQINIYAPTLSITGIVNNTGITQNGNISISFTVPSITNSTLSPGALMTKFNSNGSVSFYNSSVNQSADFSKLVIQNNFAGADTVAEPILEKAGAKITLNNITYALPFMKRNTTATGLWEKCPSTVCKNISYSSNTYVFNVTGFSNYSLFDSSIPPSVTLYMPADNSWNATSSINFTFIVSDDDADSCQVYTNSTGSWALNATKTVANATNGIVSVMYDGGHSWNILCNDTVSNSSWAINNWSFSVDTTLPNITVQTPIEMQVMNGTIRINTSLTELNEDVTRYWLYQWEPQNLINNSDFEFNFSSTNISNWTEFPANGETNPIQVDNHDYYYGTRGVRISHTVSNSTSNLSTHVTLNTNTQYTFSGYMKVTSVINITGGGNATLRISDGVTNRDLNVNGTKNWTRYNVSFNTGSSTSFTIYAMLNNVNGTAYFDSLMLVQTSNVYAWADEEQYPHLETSKDDYTLMLCNFNSTYNCSEGTGIGNMTNWSITNASFVAGQWGTNGILLNESDSITYPAGGNIEAADGTIELWLKPEFDVAQQVRPGGQTGLVGLWHMDNSTQDSSGLGNHGTGKNGVDCSINISGKYGSACSFGGKNNQSIRIPRSAGLEPKNITITAWVEPYGMNTPMQVIITKPIALDSYESYMLYMNSTFISFSVMNKSAEQYPSWTIPNTYGNRWIYVAITYNSINYDSSDAKIYINGISTTPIFTANGYDSNFRNIQYESTHDVYIGMRNFSDGKNFNGTIDEVAIWNRSLSADEIRQQYGDTSRRSIIRDSPAKNMELYKGSDNYLYFNVSNAVAKAYVDWKKQKQDDQSSSSDDWHHLAATWVSSGKIKLYVDGAFINETDVGAITISSNLILGENGTDANVINATIEGLRISNTVREQFPGAANNKVLANGTYNSWDDVVSALQYKSGYYRLRVKANDSAGNSDEVNVTFAVDNDSPNLTAEVRAPQTNFNNNSVFLNITVDDPYAKIDRVWFGTNASTGLWQNSTDTASNSDSKEHGVYYFTLTPGNFSNQERIYWRYYANDTLGNIITGTLQEFQIANRLPNITIIDPDGFNDIGDSNYRLVWNATDEDGDNLTVGCYLDADTTGYTKTYMCYENITTTFGTIDDEICYLYSVAASGSANGPGYYPWCNVTDWYGARITGSMLSTFSNYSRSNDPTNYAAGWLAVTHGGLTVTRIGGTEYKSFETARQAVQVKDSLGYPYNTATCNITIFNPSNTIVIDHGGMSYLSPSNGLYYYDYMTPTTEGVYLSDFNCTKEANFTSGLTRGFAADSFHVAPWANTISNINSTVNGIQGNVSLILNNTNDILTNQTRIWNRLGDIQNNVTDIHNYTLILLNMTDCSLYYWQDNPQSICHRLNNTLNNLTNITATMNLIWTNITGTIAPKLGHIIDKEIPSLRSNLTDIHSLLDCSNQTESSVCARLMQINSSAISISGNLTLVQGMINSMNASVQTRFSLVDTALFSIQANISNVHNLLSCVNQTQSSVCARLQMINNTANDINATVNSISNGFIIEIDAPSIIDRGYTATVYTTIRSVLGSMVVPDTTPNITIIDRVDGSIDVSETYFNNNPSSGVYFYNWSISVNENVGVHTIQAKIIKNSNTVFMYKNIYVTRYDEMLNAIQIQVNAIHNDTQSILTNQTRIFDKLNLIHDNLSQARTDINNVHNLLSCVNQTGSSMCARILVMNTTLNNVWTNVSNIWTNITGTIVPKLDTTITQTDTVESELANIHNLLSCANQTESSVCARLMQINSSAISISGNLTLAQGMINSMNTSVQTRLDTVDKGLNAILANLSEVDDYLSCRNQTNSNVCERLRIINITVNAINSTSDSISKGFILDLNMPPLVDRGNLTRITLTMRSVLGPMEVPDTNPNITIIDTVDDTVDVSETYMNNNPSTGVYFYNWSISSTENVGIHIAQAEVVENGNTVYMYTSTYVTDYAQRLDYLRLRIDVVANDTNSILVNQTRIFDKLNLIHNNISQSRTDINNMQDMLSCANQTGSSICARLLVMNTTLNNVWTNVSNIWTNVTGTIAPKLGHIIDKEIPSLRSNLTDVHALLDCSNQTESSVCARLMQINSSAISISGNLTLAQGMINSMNASVHSKLDSLNVSIGSVVSNTTDLHDMLSCANQTGSNICARLLVINNTINSVCSSW